MKNYKNIYCLIWVCLVALPALGNAVPQNWKQGILHLEQQVLQGEVSYDPKLDVVFCRSDNKVQTFTAQTVHAFSFFDEEAGITRTFRSLNQEQDGGFQGRREFFEVVMDGQLTLLRKGRFSKVLKARGKNSRIPAQVVNARQPAPEIVYTYFFQQPGQEKLNEIRHFRRQVLPLMADHQEEMHQFIYGHGHHFNLDAPQSFILIINFYNHLHDDLITRRE